MRTRRPNCCWCWIIAAGLFLGANSLEAGSAARTLGIPLDGTPGPLNAITDVAGVAVGHVTLIEGTGAHAVRTGVTALLPRGHGDAGPVPAAVHAYNGNGEFTGAHWIAESGQLEGPVVITNTHSVGAAVEGVVQWSLRKGTSPVSLPAVAETWDGLLNDINGLHVRPGHVADAISAATAGTEVAEGNVGGGTGMRAYDFKAGIGTASRVVTTPAGTFTLGVLVQANFGRRAQLVVAGVPVGHEFTELMPELHRPPPPGEGSLVALVATDAPLLPHQLARLARRVPLGMGRTGATSLNSSGDFALAFSTARAAGGPQSGVALAPYLRNGYLDPLFSATVEATEEAILNALLRAKTMTGIHGNTVHALPAERLQALLRRHGRLRPAGDAPRGGAAGKE